MDCRRTFSVHPPEAESGAPEASSPQTSPLSVVSDPEISPQHVDVLLPFCCEEAPTAHLPTITTTTYLDTSQQDDTGLPSPTRGRSGKRLTNIFSSMFSCFRSRDRVVALVGEADTLPVAKRGWLQRFLRCFRRTSRKG
ncbi:apoptosis-inducing factor 1, mitochondrial isoform X1 [Astyanax mexicanus]|uniref:Apoptosis-inducing factor 1, mitochondrial isoform X1 n=1 Tax=Astyanax mexicanus TaxID=7994 RepID=A0A8T2MHP0_ASTMX|nr:apoptosis-inducing factor 1, mitochondrial isoform X1 [Astyanax mexicanus]